MAAHKPANLIESIETGHVTFVAGENLPVVPRAFVWVVGGCHRVCDGVSPMADSECVMLSCRWLASRVYGFVSVTSRVCAGGR
eukprot:3431147-Rhodomonas_salina.2